MSPFADVPAIVGHRGAPRAAPENSLVACHAAVAQGAAWVEVDARLTADGVVVLRHDARLEDGSALVDQRAQDLSGLARLADLLEALPAGIGVDVELKALPGEPDHDPERRLVDGVVDVVQAAAPRPLLLTSFDLEAIRLARQRLPTVPTGFLYGGGLAAEPAAVIAAEAGASVVCPPVSVPLDAQAVKEVHHQGLALLVWTVNDPCKATALAEAGVDALCTDVPGELAAALGLRR